MSGREELQVRRRGALYLSVVAQELLEAESSGVTPCHEGYHAVDALRMAATNRLEDVSVESLAAASARVRAAFDDHGLKEALAAALRRKKPAKFELVHQVLPRLYCGGWAALNNDCAVLRRHKVSAVVSVVSSTIQRSLPAFITSRLHVVVNDAPEADLLTHLPRIVRFIDENRMQGRSVYVHCGAGISRAPSACIAFVMSKSGLAFPEAAALVKRGRPCARPNEGFKDQLRAFESQLRESRAPAMGGGGPVPQQRGDAAAGKDIPPPLGVETVGSSKNVPAGGDNRVDGTAQNGSDAPLCGSSPTDQPHNLPSLVVAPPPVVEEKEKREQHQEGGRAGGMGVEAGAEAAVAAAEAGEDELGV
uniref:Protein-tyrosine-phosphatase n=1 Tax=Rhizochromulina marina TaxID=1034831 RepID=A0A7S2WF89_9STRA|mmetsp:Transcript_23124/g.67393  ORF Transcript_23124/g.67393 Transcript_23124/m.67393 type:complete len:363 (+) Transcript_23124:4-1092(+)